MGDVVEFEELQGQRDEKDAWSANVVRSAAQQR
jgi:hypothetical protein